MTEPIVRECSTGKRGFRSRRVAKRWARSRNHFRGRPWRVYECRTCGVWHVTTQSTADTTWYRERGQ